jgi:GT2 family glycosyltransferase
VALVNPELTIAVVLHNSGGSLVSCLRSLQNALEPGWAELIAVDNASPDGSGALLREEVPAAQLLTFVHNRGFAVGANAAMARAKGRYWLLLNPDVRVPVDGLHTLVSWMDRHPKHGVASPEIVGADGRWQSPGRACPSIGRALLELTRIHRALPRGLRGQLLRGPYWTGGDQVDAGWVPGTSMIVRPAAVEAIGPLREDLFMYGEDLEWCWRMRHAGWRVGVCAETTFVHDTSSSARATFGEAETQRRIAAGIDGAHRVMYGARRAQTLAAVTAVALALESWAPRRDGSHRLRARRAAGVWWRLARRW